MENEENSIFGYEFRDATLLKEALTTPSCRMADSEARDNQRLEFLGDAVLNMLSAMHVYKFLPTAEEGDMTITRTHMVSTLALCAAARRENLLPRLRCSKGAAPITENSKTLADAIEAIFGAVWLDGGLDGAQKVFEYLRLTEFSHEGEWSRNPKGELQIRAQAMEPPRNAHYTTSQTGKPHDPEFISCVSIDGVGSAVATARTRKGAEAAAAEKLLSQLDAMGLDAQSVRAARRESKLAKALKAVEDKIIITET